MNISLINLIQNEKQILKNSEEEINESVASKYDEYLEEFSCNFVSKYNDTESMNQQELINESEINQLFNIENINNASFNNDGDSFIKEVSQILKKKNLSISDFNKTFIFNEKDISFNNSKNILSFLEEEDEKKSFFDEIKESFEGSDSFYENKNIFFQKFLKFKKQPVFFKNNLEVYFTLEKKNKNSSKSFIVLKNGLYNSKKNIKNKNILIGRLENFQDFILNDIVIPNNTVSRVHCQLIDKNFFHKNSLKKKYFFLIQYLKKKSLTNVFVYKILSFLIPKPGIYLQDLNSNLGTFIKLQKNERFLLKEGHSFLLGSEASFNILYIKNTSSVIFKMRKKIKIDIKNTDFIGFESTEINKNMLLKENFILMETKNCSSNLKKYIIIKANSEKNYFFGRKEGIDIKINLNDISRIHCHIFWSNSNWYLKDGFLSKNSINGTWFNIQNLYYNCNKFPSKILLKNLDTFKIDDEIFTYINQYLI